MTRFQEQRNFTERFGTILRMNDYAAALTDEDLAAILELETTEMDPDDPQSAVLSEAARRLRVSQKAK